ncbi:MAG: ROK family protein [Candidatus Omnitrophica bacterium]|nr:ROK family protein [Candidatus Omnitrophota bacterium]
MKYYIGIDIGATKVKLGILDNKLKIIKRSELDTHCYLEKSRLIFAIRETIFSFIERYKRKPQAIGIGVPGLVDPYRGLVYYLVNISGWDNVYLKKILEDCLKVPVFIDNDVNIMALAELYAGRAKGKKNVVCITLGTGVGGGLILEGKLYRGATFSAGEIGHFPLNEHGPLCNCGGKACLERYVGNRYIVEEAINKIKKGPLPTIIPDLIKNDFSKLNPEILSLALKKGDLLAKEIWQNVGKRIGIILAGIVNLLNPEMIIIGGGIAGAGKVLFENIKSTIKERAMRIPANRVEVVQAKLKENAGIIGAGFLAKEGVRGGRG